MSVGPTRGPVQRPGLDRDLTEIFQRLDDLERVKAGGDWILVERQTANGSAGFDFQDIPQDASSLVVVGAVKGGNPPCPLSFNSDGAAHYATLTELVTGPVGGAVRTDTIADSLSYIDLLTNAGTGTWSASFTIWIPGYHRAFTAGSRPRRALIEVWSVGNLDNPDPEAYQHATITAWWNDDPGAAASAIIGIQLLGNGVEGGAELYKVM